MFHIASVHLDNDLWYNRQIKYFEKFIDEPYQLYLSIPPLLRDKAKDDGVHYTVTDGPSNHGPALNLLAKEICAGAEDDDVIIFIDGDAIPIDNIATFVKTKMETYPIVAVQRREMLGELFPHPLFFATSVRLWKDMDVSWHSEYVGRRINDAELYSPGGDIYNRMVAKCINWYPMWRSNKRFLHPAWFAIYDDVIYHHGGAFRIDETSIDQDLTKQSKTHFDKLMAASLESLEAVKLVRANIYKEVIRRNTRIATEMDEWIDKETNFYSWLLDGDDYTVPPPEFTPYCEHPHRHFKPYPRTGDYAVECFDCLAVGPTRKDGLSAQQAFDEAAADFKLRQVELLDWQARYAIEV